MSKLYLQKRLIEKTIKDYYKNKRHKNAQEMLYEVPEENIKDIYLQ